MYSCYRVPLRAFLPVPMRLVLGAQLRRICGIVTASVKEKEVILYYKGLLDIRAVTQFVRTFENKRGVKREIKEDLDASAYRREAVLSVGGFIAMNILHKASPEFYGSILFFRRLFTLFIARRFIRNGVMGFLEDKQANADTLTATAVLASVL